MPTHRVPTLNPSKLVRAEVVLACDIKVAMYLDEVLMIMAGAFKVGGQQGGPSPCTRRGAGGDWPLGRAPPPLLCRRVCPLAALLPRPPLLLQADGGGMYRWALREQEVLCPGACWLRAGTAGAGAAGSTHSRLGASVEGDDAGER